MANRRVSDASRDLMPMANQNGCGVSSGLRPMANRAIDASLRPMAMKPVVAEGPWPMQHCKAQFPLCPHNKALGSWICIKDGHLDCKACHLMGCANIWGSIRVKKCLMKKTWLQRREWCPTHLDAVARLTKCDKCKASSDSVLAPSKDAFQAVWRARCSGGPSQSAIEKFVGQIPRKGNDGVLPCRSIAHG